MTTTNTISSVGVLTWWNLDGVWATPARLRNAMAANGFDPSKVIEVDQIAAVKGAVGYWRAGRPVTHRSEVVHMDATAIEIGILTHERVGAKEVRWIQIDTITFDIASMSWSNVGTTQEATKLIATVDHWRTHHHSEFIRPKLIMPEIEKLDSFRMRDGFYFVPSAGLPVMSRLASMMKQIGTTLSIMHISPTDESREALGRSARETLEGQLSVLRDRIATWKESTRKMGDKSATKLLGEFAEIKRLGELYQGSLEVALEDLLSDVEGARAEAIALIEGETFTAPAPVAKTEEQEDAELLANAREKLAEKSPAQLADTAKQLGISVDSEISKSAMIELIISSMFG